MASAASQTIAENLTCEVNQRISGTCIGIPGMPLFWSVTTSDNILLLDTDLSCIPYYLFVDIEMCGTTSTLVPLPLEIESNIDKDREDHCQYFYSLHGSHNGTPYV